MDIKEVINVLKNVISVYLYKEVYFNLVLVCE